MENFMIVKVKYTNSGMTLSTDRFTYEMSNGIMVKDRVRLSRDYNYNTKSEQAIDWLKKREHNVVGVDNWGQNEGYIIVADTDGLFKSISGIHEENRL